MNLETLCIKENKLILLISSDFLLAQKSDKEVILISLELKMLIVELIQLSCSKNVKRLCKLLIAKHNLSMN